jgi:hypothetical protein
MMIRERHLRGTKWVTRTLPFSHGRYLFTLFYVRGERDQEGLLLRLDVYQAATSWKQTLWVDDQMLQRAHCALSVEGEANASQREELADSLFAQLVYSPAAREFSLSSLSADGERPLQTLQRSEGDGPLEVLYKGAMVFHSLSVLVKLVRQREEVVIRVYDPLSSHETRREVSVSDFCNSLSVKGLEGIERETFQMYLAEKVDVGPDPSDPTKLVITLI